MKGLLTIIIKQWYTRVLPVSFLLTIFTSLLISNAVTAANTNYYVDCSASTNGSGSDSTPFNNLAAISAVPLNAGDSVLFKRGATCLGQYAPSGSGTSTAPILISSYGSGTDYPVINANGQTNAVLLQDMQYVQLENLELLAPGNGLTPRRGVYVYSQNSGDLYGVIIQNLKIHEVRGQMPSTTGGGASSSSGKFKNASGGIIIESQGITTPTAYHDIKILNNTISSVDREGIYFWSNWCKRPELNRWGTDCTANWYPHTNITIKGNQLSDIGGDGIVPKMVDGGVVEYNNLDGFNVRSKSYNAGLWTANSNNIIFQYNRVTGGISTLDGMAYDIDHATDGILFQYNLSYNNQGGFFLFCPDSKNTKNFIVRYNVSINDRAQLFLQGCGGEISNGQIYNNTMYVGSGLSPNVYVQSGSPIDNVKFFNNIVYKTGTGTVGWSLTDTDFKIDHNILYNVSSTPTWAINTTTSDPIFVNSGGLDPVGYRLGAGSPALGSGVVISSNGGFDYFGNAVSSTSTPSIGAYEGPLLPAPVAVPIAHYQLNETSGNVAQDNSSYARNGSLVGSPIWNSNGAIHGSLHLKGSGDYVNIPNSFNPGIDDFTIAGWVKLDAAAGGTQVILQQEGSTGRTILYRNTTTGVLSSFLGNTQLASTTTIPVGQWTHVAITKSNNTATLYLNGQSAGSATRSVESSTGNFRLGSHKSPDGTNVNWNGDLDDFRIYNSALPASQIISLYNAANPIADYELE
ncbi:LamG domain-containing protein [Paenibacillus antarcticus]|uniref:LamG-like jellyroll fold domain-containing protein n=1 Tax=Paenibacillus antarcticus TaxID=253703 RepID=A0A168Q6B1_9BACL|nr:LamG domain-containing protein [Paenibacillus antarcticus]OAB47431.1 hypothetical protein PBAT_06990 [Paenibacillus antarcticus]